MPRLLSLDRVSARMQSCGMEQSTSMVCKDMQSWVSCCLDPGTQRSRLQRLLNPVCAVWKHSQSAGSLACGRGGKATVLTLMLLRFCRL